MIDTTHQGVRFLQDRAHSDGDTVTLAWIYWTSFGGVYGVMQLTRHFMRVNCRTWKETAAALALHEVRSRLADRFGEHVAWAEVG